MEGEKVAPPPPPTISGSTAAQRSRVARRRARVGTHGWHPEVLEERTGRWAGSPSEWRAAATGQPRARAMAGARRVAAACPASTARAPPRASTAASLASWRGTWEEGGGRCRVRGGGEERRKREEGERRADRWAPLPCGVHVSKTTLKTTRMPKCDQF